MADTDIRPSKIISLLSTWKVPMTIFTLHFRGLIIINFLSYSFFAVILWRWSKYFWNPWCIAAFLISFLNIHTEVQVTKKKLPISAKGYLIKWVWFSGFE